MRSRAARISLMLWMMACSGAGQNRPSDRVSRDPYLILAAEVEATPNDNLYDAVRRLRPGWFNPAGQTRAGEAAFLVYFDDQLLGATTTLRQFPTVPAPARIRYLRATEAQVRYGQNNGGRPAVVIESGNKAKP
jgi:hypothetical protein